jgi:hypothetical protein
MPRTIFCACSLFLIAFVSGCGDGKSTVHGTVVFDGTPVKTGSIVFVSAEGGVREGAVIGDGAFATRMPPGTYKVELYAKRVIGTRTQKGFDGKDEVVENTEPLFPDYYSTKSELTEVIKPGDNVLTLNLKSK